MCLPVTITKIDFFGQDFELKIYLSFFKAVYLQ